MNNRLLRFAAVAIAASAIAGAADAAEEKVLNVYNWSDYIADDTLKRFTDQTGIKVNYDVYDSNEILEAKLTAKKSGYDVVFPSATPYLQRAIQAGLVRKLDRTKIPNYAKVDPKALAQIKVADPDNAYAIPYMMAGTGVGYNVEKLKQLLPDAPIGSLALLFDPKVLFKIKGCGVTLLDAAEEVFAAALAYSGKNPTSTARDDLKLAVDVVTKARLNYRYVHSSAYINDLANGATCVAMGYAGDLVQARDRAREAKNKVEIGIFLPKEGAAFNIDVMAIPADAPHPENAHLFIDFLLTPAIIGAISNKVGYANAVPEARAHMDKAILADPVIYPPAEVKLYPIELVPAEFERERNREWSKVKAKRK